MSQNEETPTSQSSWKQMIRTIGSDPETLTVAGLGGHSASKITHSDFLHLKTIWTRKSSVEFKIDKYVEEDSMSLARSMTRTDKCLQFAQEVWDEPSHATYHEDSVFSLVKMYQHLTRSAQRSPVDPDGPDLTERKVLVSPRRTRAKSRLDRQMESLRIVDQPRTPSPGRKQSPIAAGPTPLPDGFSPAAALEADGSADEMLVNMALVLLLNALVERTPLRLTQTGYQWLPNRVVMKINDDAGAKLLEARTDGCLHSRRANHSAAILEVKPYFRDAKRRNIEWQESAQMAAYIHSLLMAGLGDSSFGTLRSSSSLKRRLLISQDNTEVYITIAEYDKNYETYITGGRTRVPRPVFTNSVATTSASTPARSLAQPRHLRGLATPTREVGIGSRGSPSDLAMAAAAIAVSRSQGVKQPALVAPQAPTDRKGKAQTPTDRKEKERAQPEPEDTATKGFLVMNCFGPWNMRTENDVRPLCRDLTALSIYLSRR